MKSVSVVLFFLFEKIIRNFFSCFAACDVDISNNVLIVKLLHYDLCMYVLFSEEFHNIRKYIV